MKLKHFLKNVLPVIRAGLDDPNDVDAIRTKAVAMLGDQALVDEEGNEIQIEQVVLVPASSTDEDEGDGEDEGADEGGEPEGNAASDEEGEMGKLYDQLSKQFGSDINKMREALVGELRKKNATTQKARVTSTETKNQLARTFGWKSMGEQLSAIAKYEQSRGQVVDKRLVDVHTKAPGGLSAGIGADGGFLLAPEFSDRIMQIVHEQDNLLDRTDNFDINGPSIKIPAIDETSRATGSRRGGVRAYWLDEADTLTSSKPKTRLISLTPHKLGVLAYITEELLEDGGSALEQIVSASAADEINFMVSDAVINGDGAGKPLGIMNSGALVTASKEAGQAAATIVPANIVNMYSRLHRSALGRAVWLVNQDIQPQLFTMTLDSGTAGQVVYMPPGGLSGQPYATLMGRPVVVTEFNQTLGTAGDILLADLKQYLAVTRGAIRSAVSMHVQFLTDEMAYRFIFRVDGQPWWNSALTPFKGTATQSPFIALGTRN
jgi:HK97 family phage major capsid protein